MGTGDEQRIGHCFLLAARHAAAPAGTRRSAYRSMAGVIGAAASARPASAGWTPRAPRRILAACFAPLEAS